MNQIACKATFSRLFIKIKGEPQLYELNESIKFLSGKTNEYEQELKDDNVKQIN